MPTKAKPKAKKTSPCTPWKRQCYCDYLDGERNITALAQKYGKKWDTVKKAIADERTILAQLTGDVELARDRYIERLRYAEGLAEELWTDATSANAQASALKAMITIAEKIAAASGVATVREATESEPMEDLIRRLVTSPARKVAVDQRN